MSNVAIGKKEKEVTQASVTGADAASNTADLANAQGTFHITIPVAQPTGPGECYIQPVESIDDGLLWEPCTIEGHNAVRINTGHPYYQKVYLPNLTSGVTDREWTRCSGRSAKLNLQHGATRFKCTSRSCATRCQAFCGPW